MGNFLAVCLVNVVGGFVVYTGKGLWLLATLGFTGTGVAANSPAALAMSFFGNVAAGTVIAMATSLAMK